MRREKEREHLEQWLREQNPSRESLLEGLRLLHEHFVEEEDHVRAHKCEGLIAKLDAEELIFAFCGHFSAGKSTMINALVGEELLPSNPIPTSANVVKVKTGEPKALVGFKEKGDVTFPYPYDLAEIQQYCTDGDAVDYVEISHPSGKLPDHTAILDTPGIDSNDDAHRVAAQSRLHTADLVIYVMDYHHVQSRVNLEFIKELQAEAKPTYLVVNQIDKHLSEEIDFMIFRKRIEDAFADAGASYDHLFFTSMREASTPHNELDYLKAKLAEMMQQRKAVVLKTVLRESRLLIEQHINWKKDNHQDEIDMLIESLGAFHTVDQVKGLLDELRERYISPRAKREEFEETFQERMERLLEYANIMPYHTREGARSFLESRQLGFQVSGLFKKRKTKEEKERRLENFYKDLSENVKVYIDIHLKKLFEDFLQQYHVFDDRLRKEIHDFHVKLDKKLLERHINKGALLSGESLMNYCAQVRKEIDSLYKQKTYRWIEQISLRVEKQAHKRLETLREEEERLHRKLKAAERLEALENGRKELFDRLLAKISDNSGIEEHEESTVTEDVGRFTSTRDVKQKTYEQVNIGQAAEEWLAERVYHEEREQAVDHEQVVQQLTEASALLEGVKGFDYVSRSLQRRAESLQDRSFTVALFGAFSAGKSSFANALMQEAVLPVSPNPTTAAINEVLPPDEQHPHQRVLVKFKTREQLLDDVNHLLTQHQLRLGDLSELSGLLNKHDEQMKTWRVEEAERNEQQRAEEDGDDEKEEETIEYPPLFFMEGVQVSFLRAVQNGLAEFEGSLGTEIETEIHELSSYAAVEERACFIEKVRLYYDCDLTRAGITLVDTPGADSMNARHTEVAFDYVTDADAVLFVTYYNHAFSRADREFLTQLGRVKDAFSQDKMFFIVNAADLAEKTSELFDVLTHVENNLLACGIRHAKLYPVSSHLAIMTEKHNRGVLSADEEARYLKITGFRELPERNVGLQYAGISAFRRDFETFIQEELSRLVVKQAVRELDQVAAQLEEWLSLQQENAEDRERQLEMIRKKKTEVLHSFEEQDFQIEYDLVEREIEELLYYAKQRLFFHHGDEFKALFTPMSFRENETLRTSLLRCISDLLRYTSRELAQEMRAAAFRTETFALKKTEAIYEKAEQMLEEAGEILAFTVPQFNRIPRPHFEEGFQEVQPHQFEKYVKAYKSTAAFFAEEAHKMLREKIELTLHEPVNEYVEEAEIRLKDTYLQSFEGYRQKAKADITEQINAHFDGKVAVLSDRAALGQYKHLYSDLLRIIRDERAL
ncbi:dynamin family protein [Bacillus tianshenii]|nr:dynamin family protein [Bacillus tianshenii]